MSDEAWGIACGPEGCQPLTRDEAQRLWDEAKKREAEVDARLPDERSAIVAMFEAFDRLRRLGWKEAMYCPKDGSMFSIIEPGSTGVFDCAYVGEWPDGYYVSHDETDSYVSHPILFKPKDHPAARRVGLGEG